MIINLSSKMNTTRDQQESTQVTQLLIVGGSDAGISAALRARELDKDVEITVVVADSFPIYSVCGIPFFISGEVPDWHNLAHRTHEEIVRTGIDLLLGTTAQAIDSNTRTIYVSDAAGKSSELHYDRLIIGTGA
jgi:NADPH-dependent 2,4-dienoyl-CoA reductase/sulfur reductase-like enzyme